MFESLVASLLNRYLSDYIDEVDYNNLKLGIFSGTLELLNIKVKPSAMYQFDLPVDVKGGTIGRLKINISWRNILTKPAVAVLEDLFVLLGPFEEKINDPARIEELCLAHKRKQLQEFENLDKREIVESRERGYAEKVQDTIINNIQVYVQNVHIRYEDKHSLKDKSISFGVYLKEFKAETVDEDNKPNFMNAEAKIIYKLGSLSGFNMYWNCDFGLPKDLLISSGDDFDPLDNNWIDLMKNSIDSNKILRSQFCNFLEKNLDLVTRLTIRRSYEKIDSTLPRITIQSSVESIEFVFHRLQYKSILEIVDHYTMLNLHKKYVKYRPGYIKDKKEKARAWWHFAFTAYAETTWRQFRKERMLGHFKNYKLYMKKYEEKLVAEQAGKELEQRKLDYLEKLERDLVLESIFDIRNVLMNKYKLNEETNEQKETDIYDRPLNYVQFRLILNFPLISFKLKNGPNQILCLNLKSIISRFELKPVQNSVYFLLNTQGLELSGIHYTDRIESGNLVPIIKSSHESQGLDLPATYLASENAKDMLFVFCFETNPLKHENAEFSIRTRIASLEVYYEKTPISELMRFFKTDLVDFGEVRKIKEVWSKAGVIYAVENHKQFHIIAEMASPYFIIPASGTCTQPSDSIIFFLGKTLIQSRVQPKLTNYAPQSVQDLEKNFYDKLSMNVKEVQVLLVPANVDWKTYFQNYKDLNYCHHLLYPVSTKSYLYLSINPSYKKLPKMKLEADCSSIRLNFSNDKVISLYEFGKTFPLPEMPTINATNAHAASSVASSVIQPSNHSSSHKRAVENKKSDKKSAPQNYMNLAGADEIEPDDEWDGPFNLPKYINGDPIVNYSQITCRFTITDFSIDLNQAQTEYLHFIFKSIQIDFVVAKYGIFLRSGLEDLKLIDKLHTSPSPSLNINPQFTEILSSSNQNSNQIIKFYFRQIDAEAPNFDTLYAKIITNILFDCSNIHVKCHRQAIVHFVTFIKSTIDRVDQSQDTAQLETVVDKSKTVTKNLSGHSELAQDACEFNLVAKMNKLTWNMFDSQVKFGDMIVKQLSVGYNIRGAKTDLQIQLSKILINYGDEREQMNKLYMQIISCTGDQESGKFFDFSVVLYDRAKLKQETSECRDELRLNVGKIKVICLVKFVNELVEFIDPIINPLPNALTEQVKEQALEAVKQAYEESKSNMANKIYLHVYITSPQVIIPRNSHSLSAFVADLGTVKVTNRFVDETAPQQSASSQPMSTIQCINLDLLNLEIKRVVYKKHESSCDILEQVIKPISLSSLVRMAMTNSQPDYFADLDISASLKQVKFMVSLDTAQLLFAILAENLNEGISKKDDDIQHQVIRKDDRPKIMDSVSTTSERVTLKMNIDLNEIKLIIVDFELNPVANRRRNGTLLSHHSSASREESTDFQSAASNSELSNADSDNSSRSKPKSKISYFSHFEIQTIGFKYFKSENSSWTADLNMRSLVLNDVRPDSNLAVKEMFVSSKQEDFIKISYRFRPPGNSCLDFFMDNLKINLCLPYVLRIYKFAMDAIGTSNVSEPKIDALSKNRPNSRPDGAKYESDSSLMVNGRINLREVVLFAQPEKVNSQILIMEAELVLKFDSVNSASNLELDLTNLSLRLGEHNLRRQGIPFLSPCSGKVSMRQIDPKKPARYLAQIDSLYFNMTQTLYEVVMGVVTSINQTGTEQIQKIADEEQLLDDAEPFVKRPVEPSNYESHAKSSHQIESQSTTAVQFRRHKWTKVSEMLDLKVRQAFITFCEETSMDLQPLAIFKLQLEAHVANWSQNLHTKASLTLEASYYNDILSNWEPLIEHNMQKEDKYRPWMLSIWFALEPGGTVQPSIEIKGVPTIEFPVKDLDYSAVEESEAEQRGVDAQQIGDDDGVGDDDEDKSTHKRLKGGFFRKKKKNKSSHVLQQQKQSEQSEQFEQFEQIEQIDRVDRVDRVKQPSEERVNNASYVLVESNDLLNINITPSAYKVCMYLASITSGSQRQFMEGNVKAPLKFLNFLGQQCDLILNNRQSLKAENAIGFNVKYESDSRISSLSDDANRRVEKIMTNSQRSQIDMIYNENYKFIFCLPSFEKCRLSMKNDGSFLFPLRAQREDGHQPPVSDSSPLNQQNIKYNVMYKVRTLYGRQKIIFSSPLQIENHTQIGMLIWIELNDSVYENKSMVEFIDQMKHDDKTYVALFRLLPNKVFYVPLYVAYNCKVYVSPDTKTFLPSQIFDLRGYNLRVEDFSQIVCQTLTYQHQNFNLLRKLSLNVRSHRNVMPAMHANYRVGLYTSIRLVNSLPFQIRLDIDQNEQVLFNPILEPGDILSLNLDPANVASIRIHLLNYLNTSWFGKLVLSQVIKSNSEVCKIKMNLSPTTEMLVTGKHLNVCVTYKQPNEFIIYSPYWLINKSGQPIKIRTTDDLRTYFIPDDTILLFDFLYVRKDNKVRLTIKDGSWSKPFSFETVGTTGMIQCNDINQTYNFLMRITMSNSSRTKLITFAPFLTVANNLDEPVWIREWHGSEKKSSKHNWIRVDITNEANKPIGLWPKLVGESKQVKFVIKTTDGRLSQPFTLENPARFVLIPSERNQEQQMNRNSFIESSSKIVTVIISGGNQNPVTIVLRKYEYGDAVAKFLNLCDDLHISILNGSLVWDIEPFTSMFFVWPDLDSRVLQWTVNGCSKSEALKLTKSGTETHTFNIERNQNNTTLNYSDNDHDAGAKSNLIRSSQELSKQKQVQVCCVSYLENGQRVIVFTTDKSLAEFEQIKEASNLELYAAIRGIQLSIVNNVNLEISTVCVRGSNASWEIHNQEQIRVFSKEYSEWLESLYGDYLFSVHSVDALKKRALLNNDSLQTAEYQSEKFNLNFKKMLISKPEPGRLVRNYHPGLIFQYRASNNMTSIKCCVYKVQVDNQLPDAYFPIVLYKTPMRLVDDSQLMPFLTLSIFKELQNVTEIYRYFECTLQEFYLKADKGFLLSLKDWYEAATYSSTIEDMTFNLSVEDNIQVDNVLILIDEDKTVQQKINLDIKLSKEIMEYANQTGTIKHSAHIRFDEFYLSPMVFNLSFSVNGEAHTDDKIRTDSNAPTDYLFNFFLESIGASLTEFKDVKFSFNQFDMINETKTWSEIYDTLFDHYKIQALRQAYVLILGLDVLGNPFGLVSDFSEGFTSIFYDPLVDYLSGKNRADKVDVEFTTKLKLALNKSVSSAAGSGSLITGTLGRVLATFSFDKKYKRKRQYKISKLSTSTLSNTVSNASKGIVQGVIFGITGLINNPLKESKRGTKGVFTGVGKGFAGFVSKPIGSVLDGVSLTLDGLKRFALSGSEPITNIRLPRHLVNDVSILPYSGYQAKGYEILRDLQIDDIALDEYYWAHLLVQNKRRRTLLFITDASILRLQKTSTQILKKWKLLQNPLPLHRITISRIVPFEMPQNPTSKHRKALELCLLAKSFKESNLHQYYITFKKDVENYDLNEDTSKILLLISNESVCQWLDEKINSAIKYYRELKNYIEIV